jgi:hypothetical protein
MSSHALAIIGMDSAVILLQKHIKNKLGVVLNPQTSVLKLQPEKT